MQDLQLLGPSVNIHLADLHAMALLHVFGRAPLQLRFKTQWRIIKTDLI
jgi:hypothetical protein